MMIETSGAGCAAIGVLAACKRRDANWLHAAPVKPMAWSLPPSFHLPPLLEDHDRIAQDIDVPQRIAGHDNHVSDFSGFEASRAVGDAEKLRRPARCALNRFHRSEAEHVHPRI